MIRENEEKAKWIYQRYGADVSHVMVSLTLLDTLAEISKSLAVIAKNTQKPVAKKRTDNPPTPSKSNLYQSNLQHLIDLAGELATDNHPMDELAVMMKSLRKAIADFNECR